MLDRPLSLIAVLCLAMFALVFIAVGFLRFRVCVLKPDKMIRARATLVAFRSFHERDKFGGTYVDLEENGKDRRPLMHLTVGGKETLAAAAVNDFRLTRRDLGREFPVIYRSGFGITLLLDDPVSIRNYNRLYNTLFWVFEAIGMILAVIAAAAYFILLK